MRRLLVLIFISFLVLYEGPAVSQEKLKFAIAVVTPTLILPPLAAEEGGLWKKNGLEVELSVFTGGRQMTDVIAAGQVHAGLFTAVSQFTANAGGLPLLRVGELHEGHLFSIWVGSRSRLRQPQDLKGTRIGVARLGALQHAFGQAVVKRLGIEKEVKFISTGTVPATVAALRRGVIDALVLTFHQMVLLENAGEVRELTPVAPYLPKKWADYGVVVTRPFAQNRESTVTKMVKAMLGAAQYIGDHPDWAMAKLEREFGYTRDVAERVYRSLSYTRDGRIDPEALQNVLNFLAEYGIVSKERLPKLEELYTSKFTG